VAGQDWKKNKKGFMVNPEGKTAREVRAEKRAAAKASGGGGGGGGGGEDDLDALVAGLDAARASYHSKEARQERLKKAKEGRQKRRTTRSKEESDRLDDLFSEKEESKQSGDNPDNPRKVNSKMSPHFDKLNFEMSSHSDVGTIKRAYLDKISIKNPKKFNEEKLNEAADIIKKAGLNYDPVIVRQKNDDPTSDQYEVIGNAFIYEAAKRAGLERINTIIGDGKAENNLKTSRDQEPDTITVGPKAKNFNPAVDKSGKLYTEVGAAQSIYLDEISAKPQKIDRQKVADAARRFKEGGRNWEPVIVRETGKDKYEIVGNAHLYEAAKQAGLERVWTMIGDENTKEHKLGGSQKRRKPKA
jgi:hypothetical protein